MNNKNLENNNNVPPSPSLTPQQERGPIQTVLEGYLTKRSITSLLGVYPWVKNYFILDDAQTLAFYSAPGGKLKGQILLSETTSVKLCDKRPHSFEVTTPYVTVFLQAKEDSERDRWIRGLIGVIQGKKEGKEEGKKEDAGAGNLSSDSKEKMNKAKKKAQEVQVAKLTGRGTHTFVVAGQSFEVDVRYQFKKHIGQGAYGCVISAHDEATQTDVAVKKIKSVFDNVIDGKRILREIRLMRFLRHKNISHALDLMKHPGENDDYNDVYIVMPLMDTDLHRVIYSPQKLSNEHAQFLLYQLLAACYYLETCKVIHRDLKPSNILVNSACELRVCDFGLARTLDEGNEEPITVYVVTRWYRAPELLMTCKEYTSAIDLWSVGCILAEILGRKPLFPGDDYLAQISLIVDIVGVPTAADLKFVEEGPAVRYIRDMPKKPRIEWKKIPQLSEAAPEALALLDKLLTFSPTKRITAGEALKDPYLATYSSLPLVKSDRTFEGEDVGELEELTKPALRNAIRKEIEFYRKY